MPSKNFSRSLRKWAIVTISICVLLTIIFIGLKTFVVPDRSWLWALWPVWALFLAAIAVAVLAGVISALFGPEGFFDLSKPQPFLFWKTGLFGFAALFLICAFLALLFSLLYFVVTGHA